MDAVLGEIRAREGLARVRAAIHTVRRAGEHDARVGRVDVHGPALVILDHVAPAFRASQAAEHADRALLPRASDITGDAGIKIRLTCHKDLPWVSLQPARYANPGLLAKRASLG